MFLNLFSSEWTGEQSHKTTARRRIMDDKLMAATTYVSFQTDVTLELYQHTFPQISSRKLYQY